VIYKRKLAMMEFLTDRTTCTNEMAKKTTSEKYYQKGPPLGGGTSGQATRSSNGSRRRHLAGDMSALA
jgi:hypothetical protein